MASSRRFCDVVVPGVRLDELTYECTALSQPVAPGDCVEVRLRGRPTRGVVVATPALSAVRNLVAVTRLVDPGLLDKGRLNLCRWLASYYCCPKGEVLAAMLPRGIGGYRPRGTGISDARTASDALPEAGRFEVQVAVEREGRLERVVVFLEASLRRGGGILLAPEPRLDRWVALLSERFGADLVELRSKSGLTQVKRTWQSIRAGRHRLVVGVRSAVFAPVARLGGIVVADSRDPVFKEERRPRFNARDVAVVRARDAGCPVLLSDPFPAAETWHSIAAGQYQLIGRPPLPRRYRASFVVDARRTRGGELSPRLMRELERLPADAAAVLYVNRKGLSRYVVCAECGAALECLDCRLPAALDAGHTLVCGRCGLRRPAPETCPECDSTSFDMRTAGVESVAVELARLFPSRRVVRVESGGRSFPAGTLAVGTRVLIGIRWPEKTQLVAVPDFDMELSLPDYRVREHAFVTLCELVARAEESGAVLVVQTRRPEDPALEAGLSRDVSGFMLSELPVRREAGLPPFRRLAVIEVGSGDRGALLTHARRIAGALEGHRGVDVFGPVDSRRGRVRLLVRFPRGQSLGRLLDRRLLWQGHLQVGVDVDPLDTV
ncbi:MAG: primosomal protein N' [bacterium]